MDKAGIAAVDATAERMALVVDELLGKRWSRSDGEFFEPEESAELQEETEATCACGSGIPIQIVSIDGQEVTLIGLPLIFEQFQEDQKQPSDELKQELLETVKVYNPVPVGAEEPYAETIMREYDEFLQRKGDNQMSRTAVYNTTVTWKGEHWGHLVMGNGPQIDFSAPPDAEGHADVFTPEDAFVAAANTCIMLMFIWAAERFKLDLRLLRMQGGRDQTD